MSTALRVLTLGGALLLGTATAQLGARAMAGSKPIAVSDRQAVSALYLPNVAVANFVSFGFQNTLSQLLWFSTVSYFGEHFKAGQKYDWLYHRCKLITKINPRFPDAIRFCGLLLSWELRQPEQALEILSIGKEANKDQWLYPFWSAVIRLHFLKDAVGAKADFLAASEVPGAHEIAAKLAARSPEELLSKRSEVGLLRGMIKQARDEFERKALEERLNALLNEPEITETTP